MLLFFIFYLIKTQHEFIKIITLQAENLQISCPNLPATIFSLMLFICVFHPHSLSQLAILTDMLLLITITIILLYINPHVLCRDETCLQSHTVCSVYLLNTMKMMLECFSSLAVQQDSKWSVYSVKAKQDWSLVLVSPFSHYKVWGMWSVKAIMFSHPHLLSAAAAGWPVLVGAAFGQWESA